MSCVPSAKEKKCVCGQGKNLTSGDELHYPWMAFIKINNQLSPQCTGSIINNYWILSAGHCFCKLLKCKVSKGKNMKIAFKPKDHIRIFVGMKDLNQIESNKMVALIPKKIYIHPL